MAQEYFKNFPEMQYTLSNGKIITIKDFFRKSKIEQEAVTGLIEYTTYELSEGDRPDTVATKLYGNGDFHLFPDSLICILNSSVLRTRKLTLRRVLQRPTCQQCSSWTWTCSW